MLSLLLYGLLLFGLIYWVENSPSLKTNSLNIQKNPGEALEQWLKSFQTGGRQDLAHKSLLPQYKFYTETVELLLSMARKMGGNYQGAFLFLRQGLISDLQFEKKLKEIILGTWLQMGLMVFLTWGFIFGALSFVDISPSILSLSFIFLWQMVGVFLLPFIIRKCRHHFFQDIGKLWKMLYVLRSLAQVPLSRTEVLTLAGVQELRMIQQKNLFHLVEKLKLTCQKAVQEGGSYEEDVASIMEELRFQEKWHFELFEKRLMVVKLALMSVFFLPSYLAFVFLLLGDLLNLM